MVTRLARQSHAQFVLRKDKVPSVLAAVTVASKFRVTLLTREYCELAHSCFLLNLSSSLYNHPKIPFDTKKICRPNDATNTPHIPPYHYCYSFLCNNSVCYLTPNKHPPLAPLHSLTANIVKEGLCFVIEDLWFFFLFTFTSTSLISRVIFLLIFINDFPITCNNRF